MLIVRSVLVVLLLLPSLLASADEDKHDQMLLAIKANNISLARTLLSQNLDPNTRKDTRASPTFLTYAAQEGRTEFVRILLDAGASIDVPDGDMLTPLMQASLNGHLPAVKLLITSGASLNEVSRWGETALAMAKQSGHVAVARALEQAGAK